MMIFLIVQYLLIAGLSAWEGKYPRALYYSAASVLTVAVIWMDK